MFKAYEKDVRNVKTLNNSQETLAFWNWKTRYLLAKHKYVKNYTIYHFSLILMVDKVDLFWDWIEKFKTLEFHKIVKHTKKYWI